MSLEKQENYKKIKQYCIEHTIDLYEKMPEGWGHIKGAMTAPKGTEWVCNKKSILSGERKTGLLITD